LKHKANTNKRKQTMKFYTLRHLQNMQTFQSIHCDSRNPFAHIAQYAAEDLAECSLLSGLTYTARYWLTGNRPRMIDQLSHVSYVIDGSVMKTYTALVASLVASELPAPCSPDYAFDSIRALLGIKLEVDQA